MESGNLLSDQTIVCDNGTGYMKVGYAGDNYPSASFPTMVGRPELRSEERMSDVQLKDIMVGDECKEHIAHLKVTMPISNGKIQDWDDMENLWSHAFTEKLQVDPTTSKILLTEAPMNPKENRKKMSEIMFENYGWAHLNIQVQAVLVLYSQGAMTGVVVDSGDGVTHVVPVFESYVLPQAVESMPLAGRHLTQRLIDLMVFRGYEMERSADQESARMMKDKYCYVAMDAQKEEQLCNTTTSQNTIVTLPDGRKITLNEERYLCPEVLFDPTKIGEEYPGIAQLTFNAINKCEVDTRKAMYEKIVLSGGTTMFPGLSNRMHKDIENMYEKKNGKKMNSGEVKIKLAIDDQPRRKHLVFQGGSVLAGITKDNADWWISKEEWAEEGESALDRKCPLTSNSS